jgi:NAD(P)-dependent dehydrogenase (short-subunit alcohol dehydrogenase family)
VYDFSDKVGLVTGGGVGLGRAICLRLAEEKAIVVVNDIDLVRAQKVASTIKSNGGNSIAISADISDQNEVYKMIQQIISSYGRIDILVNNVGVCPVRSFLETELSEWESTFAINVRGMFLSTKSVVPHMIKQGGGKIVNISSEAGKDGFPLFSTYCATKHAVLGLTRALAKELAPFKINVNAVCPSSMSGTDMRDYVDKALEKLGTEKFSTFVAPPLGRMVKPSEVAGLVVFLVSSEADMMTGQAINFTGGAVTH